MEGESTNESTNENANEQPTINQQVTTSKESKNIRIKESSSSNEGGKSFTDIWKALKPYEIDKLYVTFKDAGDLIQTVYEEVKLKGKTILFPYRYVIGYAQRVGWEKL